jgi:hypothetical protein
MTLRDRFGHFVRQAVAAPAEAPEAIDPAEAAAVDVLEDEGGLADLVPPQPADLHLQLAEAREQRAALLRAGDIEGVITVDAAIARLVVALESAQARIDADYVAAPARERARLLDLWQRVHGPRIEAARARRDAAALEIWQAIDQVAAVESEASPIATALGWSSEITLTEGPVSRWMLTNWIAAHLQRVGQAPPRAA